MSVPTLSYRSETDIARGSEVKVDSSENGLPGATDDSVKDYKDSVV